MVTVGFAVVGVQATAVAVHCADASRASMITVVTSDMSYQSQPVNYRCSSVRHLPLRGRASALFGDLRWSCCRKSQCQTHASVFYQVEMIAFCKIGCQIERIQNGRIFTDLRRSNKLCNDQRRIRENSQALDVINCPAVMITATAATAAAADAAATVTLSRPLHVDRIYYIL